MSQTRISEVNIGIWNKKQVQFQANPDVNIIMGINGIWNKSQSNEE